MLRVVCRREGRAAECSARAADGLVAWFLPSLILHLTKNVPAETWPSGGAGLGNSLLFVTP